MGKYHVTSHIMHRVTGYSHSKGQLVNMRTVGDKMYSHNSNCIYSIVNLMGTLSSSLCQMLNKETVGFILVIGA